MCQPETHWLLKTDFLCSMAGEGESDKNCVVNNCRQEISILLSVISSLSFQCITKKGQNTTQDRFSRTVGSDDFDKLLCYHECFGRDLVEWITHGCYNWLQKKTKVRRRKNQNNTLVEQTFSSTRASNISLLNLASRLIRKGHKIQVNDVPG